MLASEYQDFKKPLDKHSYDACLETIKLADYFVLLIGSRIGGWYDKDNRISITQKEYREAYSLCEKGSLKIITFVRDKIWNLRQERNELKKYLEILEIDESLKQKIANHPSTVAEDAEFISSFISELGRNKETKDCLAWNGSLPPGNWIHSFSSFRDIADVLSSEMFSGLPLDEAVTKELLLGEIRELLCKFIPKIGGKIILPYEKINALYKNMEVPKDMFSNEKISVESKRFEWLLCIGIHLTDLKFTTIVLHDSLRTSVFVQYDKISNSFEKMKFLFPIIC